MANNSKHMVSFVNFAIASSNSTAIIVSTSKDDFNAKVLKQQLVI